jgi:hypothetical protein
MDKAGKSLASTTARRTRASVSVRCIGPPKESTSQCLPLLELAVPSDLVFERGRRRAIPTAQLAHQRKNGASEPRWCGGILGSIIADHSHAYHNVSVTAGTT